MVKIKRPKMKKGSKVKWFGPKKPPPKSIRVKEALRFKRNRLRGECSLPSGFVAKYLFKQKIQNDGKIIDETGISGDAQLVKSNCMLISTGLEKILVPDLAGSETVLSSGGTSTPVVGIGEITFSIGTCWNLKLSSSHVFPLAEGATGLVCNIGTGNDGALDNGVIPDMRNGETDDFHQNTNEDTDLYENGVTGEELRVPAGKIVDEAGYIQVGTMEYLEENPSTELTGNPDLEWVGPVLTGYSLTQVGIGTVTQVPKGTRLFANSGADVAQIINSNMVVEIGKTYYFYIDVVENISGSLYMGFGGTTVGLNLGINIGKMTAISTAALFARDLVNPSDATIGKFAVWEEGTIPSFSPTNPYTGNLNGSEAEVQVPGTLKGVIDGDVPNPIPYPLESNFGGAFTTFSNTTEKDNKQLVFYPFVVIPNKDRLKIQQCLKMINGELVLVTETEVNIVTEAGLILEAE